MESGQLRKLNLCYAGDSQALLPELAELQCQLDALDALERISIRNIL